MSAADILTIHQKLALIKQLLNPGQPGRPRYVIVSGDQPTYKMIVKIWRSSYRDAERGSSGQAACEELRVHEWLIPFPGFFHIEKQSLFPLCKEMLHGLGLEELARCCGLSPSQLSNILKHSHYRNNRTVLFNICAALIIHTSDLVLAEYPDLKDEVEVIVRDAETQGGLRETSRRRSNSKLLRCTMEGVTDCTIEIGKRIRQRVNEFFSHCPNGKHIDDVSDLFTNKPGAMVGRVPTFTGGLGSMYDFRGWVYVHLDEALEMLIIRLIKSLNVLNLPYLESCGAWLLEVSKARMIIRTVTAATRSYNRTRQVENNESDPNPLDAYDRHAVQSATVRAIVDLMRRKGFLSLEHRNSERLRNVLGERNEDVTDDKLQKLILDAENYGKLSAELHASAVLPDVFGPLSEEDIKTHFGGKRFRGVWTKSRQISTAGVVMAANRDKISGKPLKPTRDPRKALSDRLLVVTKLMTSLTLVEHAAIRGRDFDGAENARRRWQALHSARYLMSPFADAYRGSDSTIRYAKKSQILSALNLEFMEEMTSCPHNSTESVEGIQTGRRSVSFYYDYSMPQYASVMVDLMNHIWTRGTDGRRGNSPFGVTVLKLKHMLRPWFSGRRSQQLKQVHLHIDDPSNVIAQKHGEQARRDLSRYMNSESKITGDEELRRIGFLRPITVPWGTLISSRSSRDAICSLHLFCGGVAGMELAREHSLNVEVFLHGGCFSFEGSCVGKSADSLIPELALNSDIGENIRDGEVLLTAKMANGSDKRAGMIPGPGGAVPVTSTATQDEQRESDTLLRVPRSRVLKMSKHAGLEITDVCITHGESETRFVAAFKSFVEPMIRTNNWFIAEGGGVTSRHGKRE